MIAAQAMESMDPLTPIHSPGIGSQGSATWVTGSSIVVRSGKCHFKNTWDMLGLFWIIQVGRPIQCHLGQKCQKSLVRRYIFGARGIYTGFLLNEDFPSN